MTTIAEHAEHAEHAELAAKVLTAIGRWALRAAFTSVEAVMTAPAGLLTDLSEDADSVWEPFLYDG